MDETTSEMIDNINGIDRKLQRLNEASNQAKMLKNQANFIAQTNLNFLINHTLRVLEIMETMNQIEF